MRALAPHSFVAQHKGPDLYMVRRSEVPGLFERVDLEVAGQRDEAIVVGVRIAVVHAVPNQARGLLIPGGFREVCSDPENGRVELHSRGDAETWATRVGALAPARTAALARERGPELLRTTEPERQRAAEAFHEYIAPARELGALRAEASVGEQATIDNALTRPFAIPSPTTRRFAEAAIAALVRSGDPDVIALGAFATSPAEDPRERIDQLLAVPKAAIRKVRILIDLIMREHSQCGPR